MLLVVGIKLWTKNELTQGGFILNKILKNPYIFSVVTKLIIVILGFIYTVCQSRYLGVSLKGDVAYISSVTSITAIFFGCGMHQAYPYYKKKTGEDVAPLFSKLALFQLFIYCLVAVVFSCILKLSVEMYAIILLTPVLVYNKLVSYMNMVETPNKKNAIEMMANIVEVILVIGMWLFVPASLGMGILILVVKDLFLAIIYSYRIRKAICTPVKVNKGVVIEILKFGFFPMLALLMTTLNYRVDVIMLKYFVDSSSVGIYSVGVMLAERVWLIPDALKEVMISNLAKGKDYEEVCFVIRICNVACMVVVLGIILLGKPFITIFFGQEYSSAYSVTVIILIGVIFMIYYKMIGAYNIVHGKQKENFVYLVISVICNIIANLIFIPIWGNNGAAVASIFSYGISAYLFVHKFTNDNSVNLGDLLVLKKDDMNRLKKKFAKK